MSARSIIGIILFCIELTGSTAALAAYPDVSGKNANSRAIEYMRIHKIMTGYPDGSFGPDIAVNRAELMKILVEASGFSPDENTTIQNCFPDVPATAWFNRYVCFAAELGWVNGYPDGTFHPEQRVNFAEALKMILETRFRNYWFASYVDQKKYFTQKDFERNWYDPYKNSAMRLGIITEEGTFSRDGQSIDGPVPRKRIAEMLYRSFLAEDNVRWPIDISGCVSKNAVSARVERFVSAEHPDAQPSEGQRLSSMDLDGRTCALAEDINPYSRITKDYGARKMLFFMWTDDPEDAQVFSTSTLLQKNIAYLIDYTSDAGRSPHLWRLDLNKGELVQVRKPGSDNLSAMQMTKDYSLLFTTDGKWLRALNLSTGQSVNVDEIEDPYLLLVSFGAGSENIVNTPLPAKIRIVGDEVRYTVYEVRPGGNAFEGPYMEHEVRTKKLSDIFGQEPY